MNQTLRCVMPWKAFFLDECGDHIVALPCCLSWIRADYGKITTASLQELWNGRGAREIRRRIAEGEQGQVCDPSCPHWLSGDYGEDALRILDGPPRFVENQELNHREIRARSVALQSQPMLLKILPTLECNLRCTMCYQDSFGSVELGQSFWSNVDELLPFIREITFQGGEVAKNGEFRSFLGSTTLRNHSQVRISLITNGTVWDPELRDLLSGVRINCVVISLNAATRETYRRITRADLFDQVLTNVERFKLLSVVHPLHKFDVFLSFVVMKSNFMELANFVKLADRLGVALQLHPVCGDRGGEGIFRRPAEHAVLREVLHEANRTATNQATRAQLDRLQSVLDHHAAQTASELVT